MTHRQHTRMMKYSSTPELFDYVRTLERRCESLYRRKLRADLRIAQRMMKDARQEVIHRTVFTPERTFIVE